MATESSETEAARACPPIAIEAWETKACLTIGALQVILCSYTEISCAMFPTLVEEEGMHIVDILATCEIHPAPTGWISLFLQTISGSEWSPVLQKFPPLLCRTAAISSAPRPGEASIPPDAEEEDPSKQHLLPGCLSPEGKQPSKRLVKEETK